MIRAIVLASIYLGALAAEEEMAPPEGFATCQCLGADFGLEKLDCTYEWASSDGKCVMTNPNKTQFNWYPGDYGETCKAHLEPGAADCFDQTTDPPTAKILTDQKTWCNDPWCYVDPCACDVQATPSTYFPTAWTYSYSTCGGRNNFLAESDLADAGTEAGAAVCTRDGKSGGGGGGGAATASPETSDTKCFTVGLGIMLSGIALV